MFFCCLGVVLDAPAQIFLVPEMFSGQCDVFRALRFFQGTVGDGLGLKCRINRKSMVVEWFDTHAHVSYEGLVENVSN